MNTRDRETIYSIVRRLREKNIGDLKALLGFDACIDSILRAVKSRGINNDLNFFTNIREFGEHLIKHENLSCGIELNTRLSKTGGNMVIMANALGNLGLRSDCIGTFGLPEILPVFRSMSPNCSLYTVGETINASALEFNDSKIIMFDPGPYNELEWKDIRERLGLEKIIELFSGRRLVAFLNWSELAHSSEIWKGVIDDILPHIRKMDPAPLFFADFSDCSRRTGSDLNYAISLLADFRKTFRVGVSLNQNEATLFAYSLGLHINNMSDEEFIKLLYKHVGADELVIHRTKDASVYDGHTYACCSTFFCEDPRILTGGGDNFNAGYCFARLSGFDLYESVLMANAVSGSYVRSGISPDVSNLISFLEESI